MSSLFSRLEIRNPSMLCSPLSRGSVVDLKILSGEGEVSSVKCQVSSVRGKCQVSSVRGKCKVSSVTVKCHCQVSGGSVKCQVSRNEIMLVVSYKKYCTESPVKP
jgi:hypothetical protein